MSTSTAEARHILEQRARELARVPDTQRARGENYLTFRVGDESFALPVPALLQVLRQPSVAPLPGSALPLAGVTGWRGELLMVFEIAAAAAQNITEAPYIVVLASDPPIGIRVDDVSAVVEIATSAMQTLSAARAHREYARGVTSDSIVVVDAAALIDSLIKPEAP